MTRRAPLPCSTHSPLNPQFSRTPVRACVHLIVGGRYRRSYHHWMDRATPPDPVERALRRASASRARADRLVEVYQRLESQAAGLKPSLAWILRDTATRHRESERRLRAVATLHQHHADRLARAATLRNMQTATGRPPEASARGARRRVDMTRDRRGVRDVADADVASVSFIAAISQYLDEPSTALSLASGPDTPPSNAASDATSRAAIELDFTLGEGPAHDLITGVRKSESGSLSGRAITSRWPIYGPALSELGVRAVVVAPLGTNGTYLGALLTFRADARVTAAMINRVRDLAIGLTESLHTDTGVPDFGSIDFLVDEADIHPVVHQAAGVLSVQLGLGIVDAYAMLRARAFAEGKSLDTIAANIITGRSQLTL